MDRLTFLLLLPAGLWSAAVPASFRIQDGTAGKRVQILSQEQVVAESPAEGLWSIACDWKDGWPAEWSHAAPAVVETRGEWTILRGRIQACGGEWRVEDAYRSGDRALHASRRFQWRGTAVASRVTLAVRWVTGSPSAKILLPGIIYYGNPSGARSGRVPVWMGQPGEEAIFEEHRYPMPFAFVEMENRGVALHSEPSPAPFGNLKDQWWSLGVMASRGAQELVLLSGPCAANGKRSSIKAYQREFRPYDNAYLNVPPGAIIEKSFALEAFPVAVEGSGFQRPVATSLALFEPFDAEGMPRFPDIIHAKYRYALSRWHENGPVAGFRKYADRSVYVMGWTGQAEALAYALPVLAPGLGDSDALRKAGASLDFLSTAEFYPGGFRNWYDYSAGKWTGDELLNQGQAMFLIARAVANARKSGASRRAWEEFLRRASRLHAQRILDPSWRPVSTNEAVFVPPLAVAAGLFGDDMFRRAALRAGEHYLARHLSMREPYWGGTLDARCEDKEGAAAAFQAFLALHEMTREQRFLDAARHAADVVLSYVVVWDIDLPPSRLRDHRFRTRGWTSVSPQNQHLDVWGTIVAPDLYRLGQLDGRDDLKRLAILMYRTCGQLIDPYGGQGEQMEHTNYVQRNKAYDLANFRGGYNEEWTVFWITAHFLTGAARFAELGVDVWK